MACGQHQHHHLTNPGTRALKHQSSTHKQTHTHTHTPWAPHCPSATTTSRRRRCCCRLPLLLHPGLVAAAEAAGVTAPRLLLPSQGAARLAYLVVAHTARTMGSVGAARAPLTEMHAAHVMACVTCSAMRARAHTNTHHTTPHHTTPHPPHPPGCWNGMLGGGGDVILLSVMPRPSIIA
jgi:hypothetical protein